MSMGVYIKGMEMPTSCGCCPIGDALCCPLMPGVPALWEEYDVALRTNRRHENCPLVPVPPHGRLIDADMFNVIAYRGIPDGRENTFDDGVEWLANKIDTAPTIIEAEVEE